MTNEWYSSSYDPYYYHHTGSTTNITIIIALCLLQFTAESVQRGYTELGPM